MISHRILESKLAFVFLAPLLTVLGAATTVVAPLLLDPVSFTQFALLNSLMNYLAEFDLGLSRQSDRMLPLQSPQKAESLVRSLLFARYCVASALAVVITAAALSMGSLTLIAGFGGIGILLSNGPVAYYRARSQTAAFVFSSLLVQFGVTLPRLIGLLADGVRGCVIMLAVWFASTCVLLNAPFFPIGRGDRSGTMALLLRSVPLFVFGNAWIFYLLANRWVSWLISSPTDAGLFAFGASLAVVVVFMIGTLSQPYYPRHLALANPSGLAREMRLLLALGTAGCVAEGLFCRFGLRLVFPNFAEAAALTAVLLLSALPLGLAAWLMPLVIARSKHATDVLIFPISFSTMAVSMWIMGGVAGIDGQAWACVPPALLLLGGQLRLVAKSGLLCSAAAKSLWSYCFAVICFAAVAWWFTFR